MQHARALADAAAAAWEHIANRADRHDAVGMGADGTPTTRADHVLDAAVLETAAAMKLTVLSEEAGFVDHGSDRIAIVDPLDGSRNAGRGIPFFCTSVAIGGADLSDLDAAVVINLATGDRYEATAGEGATFNGQPCQPRPHDPAEVLVAILADYDDPERVGLHQARKHHMRDMGSAALELCLVGTGGLDAFAVRRPWLRVIDIAAGTLFCREAGGLVVDPATGQPLATPCNLDARTGIIATRDPSLMEVLA